MNPYPHHQPFDDPAAMQRLRAAMDGLTPLAHFGEASRPYGADWAITGPDGAAWQATWNAASAEVTAWHNPGQPPAYREPTAGIEEARRAVAHIAGLIEAGREA